MNVAVIMTTYLPDSDLGRRRLINAQKCLRHLSQYISPTPYLLVSDDTGIRNRRVSDTFPQADTVLQGPNRGVGASINRALAFFDKEWGENGDWAWLYTPDDLLLHRVIGLNQAIAILNYGSYFVRLDLPHPNLSCITKFHAPIGWWLDLTYEMGGFVFATRPTLIHSSVHHTLGPFLEEVDSYETELDYSNRAAAYRLHGSLVTSPPLGSAWEHLSTDEDEVGRLTPWQHPAVAP